jgi:excisionase family DNA binding protein
MALRSVLVDHAAEILGVSRRTVYYRIREGKLRTVKTRCGSQRVLVESIEALLQEERARARKEPESRKAAPHAPEAPVAADRPTAGGAAALDTDLSGRSRVLWQQR